MTPARTYAVGWAAYRAEVRRRELLAVADAVAFVVLVAMLLGGLAL